MVASVSPNQIIAAGTQATDGRLCRPGEERADRGPHQPDLRDQQAQRRRDDQRDDEPEHGPADRGPDDRPDRPSSTISVNSSHTSTGAGSLYSAVIAEPRRSARPRRTAAGRRAAAARSAAHAATGAVAWSVGVSSASRPGTAAAASSRTAAASRRVMSVLQVAPQRGRVMRHGWRSPPAAVGDLARCSSSDRCRRRPATRARRVRAATTAARPAGRAGPPPARRG